ncbi:hypothetical protein [Paracoccus aestuariivivens]|uniref:Uncharacterized protein n=1 Tax=Paracoccus aestuariivivens TaxID=1820333 RepID=A0A6L6J301_9RHOB|nr:hypothetical protein [Paracoccus aestuariivivens]MTH76300.1 hypothetical protein [Paracoccus aestuariivivens]
MNGVTEAWEDTLKRIENVERGTDHLDVQLGRVLGELTDILKNQHIILSNQNKIIRKLLMILGIALVTLAVTMASGFYS